MRDQWPIHWQADRLFVWFISCIWLNQTNRIDQMNRLAIRRFVAGPWTAETSGSGLLFIASSCSLTTAQH
jgi:hypothetical protein